MTDNSVIHNSWGIFVSQADSVTNMSDVNIYKISNMCT